MDFYSEVGKSWADPGATFEMARPDQQDNYYYGYTTTREPTLTPQLPQAYCSWRDTFSY